MDNSGTNREHDVPDVLWDALSGHRWHATSLEGLRGIVCTGAIEIRPGYNGLCKSLDAATLRNMWMEKNRNVIPGVEGGHLGPLAITELDQIVLIAAARLADF